MKLLLDKYTNKDAIERFLEREELTKYHIENKMNSLTLEFPDKWYSKEELRTIERHFSFYDIFHWSKKGIENVTLWEKPKRAKDVINEFKSIFGDIQYEVLTSIEARGFILGGMFGLELQKPFITIRKYKKIFDTLPGMKYKYLNWKKEEELLYLFKNDFSGNKAILIDDIMETGNSLKASQEILRKQGIELVGAFYLIDSSKEIIRETFEFPVRSLLRFDRLLKNTVLSS